MGLLVSFDGCLRKLDKDNRRVVQKEHPFPPKKTACELKRDWEWIIDAMVRSSVNDYCARPS